MNDETARAYTLLQRLALFVFIILAVALALSVLGPRPAHAGGWPSFAKYEHRTGKCGGMREVAMSYYHEPGKKTSTGTRFNGAANACASNHGGWPKGAHVQLMNPHNGRSSHCVVNDTLPNNGAAWAHGVRLDATKKVFVDMGMRNTKWICAS